MPEVSRVWHARLLCQKKEALEPCPIKTATQEVRQDIIISMRQVKAGFDEFIFNEALYLILADFKLHRQVKIYILEVQRMQCYALPPPVSIADVIGCLAVFVVGLLST